MGMFLLGFFYYSYVYMVFIPEIGYIIKKSLIFMKCMILQEWSLYMIQLYFILKLNIYYLGLSFGE